MVWYCAETEPNRTNLAMRELAKLGFRTFQPAIEEKRWRLRYRRHEAVIEPLFPGYLFVELDPSSQVFQHILKARGVMGLVHGVGSEFPARVADSAMERLLGLCKDGRPLRGNTWMKAFADNMGVKVTRDGTWQGWTGKVSKSVKDRVWVWMKIFGCEREVEFP